MNTPQTVLSGIRATGTLHLGNYLGALVRFARMSRDSSYRCFFFVADMHTLTTLKEAEQIRAHLPNIVMDYLAAGVDPDSAVIYVQSSVPQVAELTWYLSCLTPVGDLERLPTYKDKRKKHPEDVNAGLLNYPVLMAADILGPRADLVPVGKDQQPHLELTSQLARKFNRLYGDYFPIPDALLHEMILVPGLSVMDERGGFPKMGKSDDNTIILAETPEETEQKIKVAPTDPKRVRRNDPGSPDNCAIYALHSQVSATDQVRWSREGCQTAGIGCVECKRALAGNVNELLREFRERRRELATTPSIVREVLEAGREQAAALFDETIAAVRERMGIGTFTAD
jgi:tryptophanyl-tRNA synthetase